MLARVYSCATVGLDGQLVEVEVDVGPGQPGMFRAYFTTVAPALPGRRA